MVNPVHSVRAPFKGKSPKQLADTLKARSALAGLIQPALGAAAGISLDTSAFLKALETLGHGITKISFSELSHGAAEMSHVWFHAPGVDGIMVHSTMGAFVGLGVVVGASEIFAGIKTHQRSYIEMGVLDLIGCSATPLILAGLGIPGIGIAIGVSAAGCLLAYKNRMSAIQKANSVFNAISGWTGAAIMSGILVLPASMTAGVVQGVKMLFLNNAKVRKKVSKLAQMIKKNKSN
jgi:hypothetical protein